MGNYQGGGNRNSGFRGNGGGRPSFQKKSWGDDRPRDMHKATCSECGKPCEVPFKPTGDKPVYCNDCFSSKRTDHGDRGPRQDYGDRGPRKSFGDRPSYQSTPRQSFAPTGGSDDTKKQLSDISNKLDRLISAMEKLTGTTKPAPAVKAVMPVAPVAKKLEIKKPVAKPLTKKKPVVKAKKKK